MAGVPDVRDTLRWHAWAIDAQDIAEHINRLREISTHTPRHLLSQQIPRLHDDTMDVEPDQLCAALTTAAAFHYREPAVLQQLIDDAIDVAGGVSSLPPGALIQVLDAAAALPRIPQ